MKKLIGLALFVCIAAFGCDNKDKAESSHEGTTKEPTAVEETQAKTEPPESAGAKPEAKPADTNDEADQAEDPADKNEATDETEDEEE